MAKGSGSAKLGLLCWLTTLGLWALTRPIYGANFYVGDESGWTFNVNNWPQDKSFKAGDVLVFNYLSAWHNVVKVNKEGYENCTSTRDAKMYQSGNDSIRLRKGLNYFICTAPAHCQAGMKILVNAS